jgi:hypothetical protein
VSSLITGGKFTASVVDTGGNLLQVLLILAANLPPVSTTSAVSVAKLAASVVDASGTP